jgi:hypothetical protein
VLHGTSLKSIQLRWPTVFDIYILHNFLHGMDASFNPKNDQLGQSPVMPKPGETEQPRADGAVLLCILTICMD